MTDVYSAARQYATQGIPVFPCQPRGKEPAVPGGLNRATTDLRVIESWWRSAPDLNIGVPTGSVSGFFVVDVDGDDGEATIRKLEAEHGHLPETIEVITGDGRHCYFRLSEHEPIRNSASRVGPGIDIRGEGGYVLAPPSVHPSGRRYEWGVDSADNFADAPDWFITLAGPSDKVSTVGKPLEEWHATLTQPIPSGRRNNTLASIAGKLLFHDVNLVLVCDLLSSVNAARCAPPLDPAEVKRIVASVAQSHLRRVEHG
jgi:hypothetical protein